MNAVLKKELPDGWVWTTLGEAFKWGSGGTPKRTNPKYYDGDIPWLIIGDLNDGSVGDSETKITEEGLKNSSAKWVEPGSVLLAMYGSIGKLGIATKRLTTNQAIAFTQPEPNDAKYLFYYLMYSRDALASEGKGATQLNISQTVIKAFPIPLAPSEQQKHIVAKIEELFSHIDAGIEALKKAKQLLKQYRQSVLKAAVTGELTKKWRESNKDKLQPASQLLERILKERRQNWEEEQLEQFKAKGRMPKDDKWKKKYKEPVEPVLESSLPGLPREWLWARLDCISEIGSGMSVSKSRKVADPIEVPYLRVANVQRGFLDLEEIKTMPIEKSKLLDLELKEWDVLYNEGGDIDKLGRGWIWENQLEPCITQNHVFRASPFIKNRYHSVFLSIWGNTFGQEHFLNTGTQTTNLASINKGVLSAFPTPVPPLEEQEQIIQIVEDKLSLINQLEIEVDIQLIKAEKNKQSILTSAFQGRLAE